MDKQNVVIVIPTYNEADVIRDTIEQVFQATRDIPNTRIHILVFDSASTDSTQHIVTRLQAAHPTLHLVTEPQKSGLGVAYLKAMRYALDKLAADIVMEFDADLSHQPHYIKPMLAQLQTHDVVVGSRYVPGGHIPNEWGWNRKLLSMLGNAVARLMLTSKYKDWTSGFRATQRAMLIKSLPTAFLSKHYAYKMQLFWALHKNNARIVEYPIVFVDRQKGTSKLPTNSVIDSLRVILILRCCAWRDKIKALFVPPDNNKA
ncbi:MAG: polyprenol monophosphomannose synthase [Gammaproteobacteria bacterium]|nr:polyprenol monophosphomannose synthase [Gammaproteobacteria bacterium]